MDAKRKDSLEPQSEEASNPLTQLLQVHYKGKIVQLTNADAIRTARTPYFIVLEDFITNANAAELRSIIDILYAAAQHYDTRITFAVADYAHLTAVLGYESAWMKRPGYKDLVYIYGVDEQHRYYDYYGLFNVEEVKAFCQKLLDGTMYRSEPLPPANSYDKTSLICTAVADNFEELVEHSAKDVLLLCSPSYIPFNTRWMQELEQLLQAVTDIKIVKIDVDTNYIPLRFNITAFPTIVFLRKHDKHNVITLEEERTLENLIRFVARNATTELKNYDRSADFGMPVIVNKPANDTKMQQFEVGNQVGIFLDHLQLIKEIYNSDNAQITTLRAELFNYHERRQNSDSSVHGENPELLKHTRKRKLPPLGSQQQNLIVLFNNLLTHLKTITNFPCRQNENVLTLSSLPRYWEESDSCAFPRFNGANATSNFIQQQFGDITYIIPPYCRFFNADILELTKLMPQLCSSYDLIVLDPPWRNKYIRRVKKVRRESGYQMLDVSQLAQLPIAQLTYEHSLVAIWCTNSQSIQSALLKELLPAWKLRLLHKLYWFKLNTSGKLIHSINNEGSKQPYEMLFVACHEGADKAFGNELLRHAALLSVPSIIHSHKPPLLPWLRSYLPTQPQCLELFARYLQPQFTSIGLEVLKLMDKRLYDISSNPVRISQ